MKELKFIKVKSLNGFHIIKINLIQSVTPVGNNGTNKSEICLINDDQVFYSTEDQDSIYAKIKMESI